MPIKPFSLEDLKRQKLKDAIKVIANPVKRESLYRNRKLWLGS